MAKKIKKVEKKELLEVIIEGMQELKAKNIVVMDLRAINSSDVLTESPRRIEGKRNAKWILMDYFNIIVHIFDEETRAFYSLEQLWGDATIKEIND